MPQLKVTIKGAVYPFSTDRYSMSEAIELEEKLGMSFHHWRNYALPNGSAKAMAGFAWLVLKRNGQAVPWQDIVTGAYELSTSDVDIEEEGGADPTEAPSSVPGGNTSEPSPSDSESGPGNGDSSP